MIFPSRRTSCLTLLAAAGAHLVPATTRAQGGGEAPADVRAAVAATAARLERELPADSLRRLTAAQVEQRLTPAAREALARGHIAFRVDVPAVVSVVRNRARSVRHTPQPSPAPFWLRDAGFRRTELLVDAYAEPGAKPADGTAPYEVWQREYEPGVVRLGVNGLEGASGHYFVAVAPRDPAARLAITEVAPAGLRLDTLRVGAEPWADRPDRRVRAVPPALDGHVLIRTLDGRRDDGVIAGLERFVEPTPDRMRACRKDAARPQAVLCPPRGVHLSFTDDPRTTATAVWFTDGTTDPGTVVEYGPAPAPRAAGGERADGRPAPAGSPPRAALADPCVGVPLASRAEGRATPAPGVAVLTHEATMRGLAPGGTVCYRVGGKSGWSPMRSFHTAPKRTAPFRFAIFGDHGTTPASEATNARVLAGRPDLAIVAGDISYANGIQPRWDRYFDQVELFASRIPYMAAFGNHEKEWHGFDERTYLNRFALPGRELFYSFDYANVHFLMLEARSMWIRNETPEEQLAVLRLMADEEAFAAKDLADAARRRASGEIDFVVVVQHYPMFWNLYWNNANPLPFNPSLVEDLEPLFQAHGVDVVVTGHNHHYERTKPIVFGRPTVEETRAYRDPAGYVHVITGGGGEGLDPSDPRVLTDPDAESPPFDPTNPDDYQPFHAAFAVRHHYVQFDVEGRTMRVQAIPTDDAAGDLLDSWSLTRTDGAVHTRGPTGQLPKPKVMIRW